jgi:hypothetical protein
LRKVFIQRFMLQLYENTEEAFRRATLLATGPVCASQCDAFQRAQIPPAYAPAGTAHVVDLLADWDERLVLGALVVSPDAARIGSLRYFFITVQNRVNVPTGIAQTLNGTIAGQSFLGSAITVMESYGCGLREFGEAH